MKNKAVKVKKTTEKSNRKVIETKLSKVVEEAEAKYGVNVLRKGFPSSSDNEWYNLKRFSTGVPSIDIALGGGIPVGRYIEVQGAESVGKTTLVLNMLREFQRQYPDLSALFADGEGTTDAPYLEQLEIEENQFLYSPSAGLEETTQLILDQMTPTSDVRLAVIDSIESLVPTKEYNKGMDDSMQMGVKPVLLAEFFRKFEAKNNKLMREGYMPMTIIGLNQLRDKIGAYGNPEFAPGGRAKDFAQSICLRLRRGDLIFNGVGENKVQVGQEVKFKVQKNKTYGPGKTGMFCLYTDENDVGVKRGWVDVQLSIILEAIKYGYVKRSGSFYSLLNNPDVKFQGRDKMIAYLQENPDIVKELQDLIVEGIRKG